MAKQLQCPTCRYPFLAAEIASRTAANGLICPLCDSHLKVLVLGSATKRLLITLDPGWMPPTFEEVALPKQQTSWRQYSDALRVPLIAFPLLVLIFTPLLLILKGALNDDPALVSPAPTHGPTSTVAMPEGIAEAERLGSKDDQLTSFQRAHGISDRIAEAAIKEWVLTHGNDFDWDLEEVKAICLRKLTPDQMANEVLDEITATPEGRAEVERLGSKDDQLTSFQRSHGISNRIAEAAIKEWVLTHGNEFDWDLEEVKAICLQKLRSGF